MFSKKLSQKLTLNAILHIEMPLFHHSIIIVEQTEGYV